MALRFLVTALRRHIWLSCIRTILSTTSREAWNGFGFTHRARGNLWPQPPWDEPRTTLPRIGSGAGHTTSMCTCPHSTGGTAADPNVMPILYVSYYVWEFRDWSTRGYQRLGIPRPTVGSAEFVNEEITSSSVSSVPDGAWREPSPPPSYDPNFDWNESD